MRHRIAAGIVTCAVLAIPAVGDGRRLSDAQARWTPSAQYLKHRGGVVGVGVIDSQGRVRGIHDKRRFVTASVIKAMLLVSYLRKVDHQDRGLTRYERSHLRPMIRVSSNAAATWAYYRVGDVRLRRLARRADMDQFSDLLLVGLRALQRARPGEVLLAARASSPRRAFATTRRSCCARSSPRQSWGIPSVGRPRGFSVFFKGGWRGTGRGQLVHQASFIRYRGTGFSLAVLTDGNPSMGYGIGTIAGVARRILRRRPG